MDQKADDDDLILAVEVAILFSSSFLLFIR
jgi:hypothetical protein